VTGCKGALAALGRGKSGLGRERSLLCDGGYAGQPFVHGVKDVPGGHVTVLIARRSEFHA